jgi:Family of unknown function (DUF5946)
MVCRECGAALAPGEQCTERFHQCMAKEFKDPTGYGSVHHLTVPAYMLQHPNRYSREGWLAARRLLVEFLVEGKSPANLRKRDRSLLNSSKRRWSITRGERMAGLEEITWSRTIADVRLFDSKVYCSDIIHWAQAVLSDTEEVLDI